MTNDELKKKIMDIVLNVAWEGCLGNTYHFSGGRSAANAIADALISVGIGDVKEAELERKAYEVASNQYRIWFEEQKDRAEVAERALKNACEDVKETISFLIELSERVDGLRVEGYLPEESEPKAYINRAEKELAEEEKE